MTATILLVRHAAHSHLGKVLSGRTPGISLSEQGHAQAARLAERLSKTPMDALQTSPVRRARQTAEAIAARRPAISMETVTALDELDFGDWCGRGFVELADDPRWNSWNRERASAAAPNGETMVAAQQRAWAHIERTARENPGGAVAMVTHCDVIRAVVVRVLGLSLDNIHDFEIGPASVSRLEIGSWGTRVLSLNEGSYG